MSPPGNSRGCTVKPSVVIMTSPSPRSIGTASACTSSSLADSAVAKTSSMSSRMKRPPLPCASEMRSSSIVLPRCDFRGLPETQRRIIAWQSLRHKYVEAIRLEQFDHTIRENAVLEHAAAKSDLRNAVTVARSPRLGEDRICHAGVEDSGPACRRQTAVSHDLEQRLPVGRENLALKQGQIETRLARCAQ